MKYAFSTLACPACSIEQVAEAATRMDTILRVVAILGLLALQFFDAFLQKVNGHQRLLQPVAQRLILLSQSFKFFLGAHTATGANLDSHSPLWDPLLNSY
jgi:hypothetical protein